MRLTTTVISLLVVIATANAVVASPTEDPLLRFYEAYGYSGMPDVAGQVNVTDATGERFIGSTWGLDEITVYPGFPVNVSSWSHEGGILYDVDGDDEQELIIYIGQSVYVLNSDGTNVPGWPQSTTYYSSGAPALGDIDGDEDMEIVVASTYTMTTGGVEAFELDGSVVSGFPALHGYVSRTPVLADLDGDGALEIIVNKREWPLGEWYVYRGDGTLFPGWPQPIGHVPSSSSAVGDITGDSIPEVIGESYDALYVWDINGNLLPGFPFYMPYSAVNSYSSPVLADLDGDDLKEIIFGTHVLSSGGYVFVLNEDGSQMPGWPKYTSSWIYGPPSIGYVDGDDVLDVVIGDQTLSPMPMNFIYGWDANGNTLPNFPIGPLNAINNQVSMADLDGDGAVELIIDDNTMLTATYEGKYLAYNNDGTPLTGWPLTVLGTTMFNMVCLGDIDNDGFVDMAGAGNYASENWTNIYLWYTDYIYDPDAIDIPCFQYNVRHDGVVEIEFTPPELAVTLTPINPPIIIPATGGSFDFTADIENTGASGATFDAWIEADLPTGGTVSPITLRENLSLPAGSSVIRDLTQDVPDIAPAGTYTYRLRVGAYPGSVYTSDEFTFTKQSTGGDYTVLEWSLYGWEKEELLSNPDYPTEFLMLKSYPNPFNSTTTISYALPVNSNIKLSIYNTQGQLVQELVDKFQPAGHYEIDWNASHYTTGLYLCKIEAGTFRSIRKILLLK